MIVDPLDLKPDWKKNPYHIVSWRVFTPKSTKPMQSTTKPMQNRIDDWAEQIKIHEGYFPGSASYRNNNPGNFRCSSLIMGELGATKCVNNLAVFPDYETGWKALKQFLVYACTDKLRSYKSTMTLLDFYKVYAPSADNNNPLNYATCVAKGLGVTVDTRISTLYATTSVLKPSDTSMVNSTTNTPPSQPKSTTTLNPEPSKDNSTSNLIADPYPIAENGTPYEPEKVDNWLIKLLKEITELLKAIWTK
jgi:hypothetical protein